MNLYWEKFLQRDRLRAFLGSRLHCGLFGKHPSYADFLSVKLQSCSLGMAKDTLIDKGIRQLVDFWGKDAIEFDHVFLWRRGNQAIFGRLWRSPDSINRADIPMIFCVHTVAISTTWALDHLLPKLEAFKQGFVNAKTPTEVYELYDQTETELRELVVTAPRADLPNDIPTLARSEFVTSTTPEHLLQVIYRTAFGLLPAPSHRGAVIGRLSSHFPGERERRDQHISRPVELTTEPLSPSHTGSHIRLSANSDSAPTTLRMWADFLGFLIGHDALILLMIPCGRSWLDLIIGEPKQPSFDTKTKKTSPGDWAFLRSGLQESPICGEHNIPSPPRLMVESRQLIEEYVNHPQEGLTPVQQRIRVVAFISIPLLAGAAVAAWLKICDPNMLAAFLRALARILGIASIRPL